MFQRLLTRSGNQGKILLLLPGILLLLPVALLVSSNGFDGLYGQDPYAYYFYAVGPLRDSLRSLQPPPPFFWPPGFPILAALLVPLLGTGPEGGRLVSLLAGALVPIFTAMLASELIPNMHQHWKLPFLAGSIAGLAGQLWQSSAVYMADTTGLAAATLGVWALARYGRELDLPPKGVNGVQNRTSQPAWLVFAGAALAFAILTRWAYALVALPCSIYALLLLSRQRLRTSILHAAFAGLAVLLILSPILAATFQGLEESGSNRAAFIGDLQVYSWSPENAFRRTFKTSDGILSYRLPNGLYYGLAPAHRFFFTPLLALLLPLGVWRFIRRRSLGTGILLLGWPAVVYSFHAGAPWQNLRFTLAYLPPLAILAASGWDELSKSLSGLPGRLIRILLVIGFLWMAAGGWTLTRSFIERKKDNLATVNWVRQQIPEQAELITFSLTMTFEYYSQFEVYDLFHLNEAGMSDLVTSDPLTYLLLDIDNVDSQWLHRSPSENYHWLRDGPGLLKIGKSQQYTLFEVNGAIR